MLKEALFLGLRFKLTWKASQLHHGAFLDGTVFASLCVQEFEGFKKGRNIPASDDCFNLLLFGRKLYEVLDGTGVAAERESAGLMPFTLLANQNNADILSTILFKVDSCNGPPSC